MINFADDKHMCELEPLAEKFYDKILRPDEEPGYVSDEASLYDNSLAPRELLIKNIKDNYGKTLTRWDFERSFWTLLVDLNADRA